MCWRGHRWHEAIHHQPPQVTPPDTLCLTYGKKVDFCEYLPQSTWTTGRNHLWKVAMRLKRKYEYYIFISHPFSFGSCVGWFLSHKKATKKMPTLDVWKENPDSHPPPPSLPHDLSGIQGDSYPGHVFTMFIFYPVFFYQVFTMCFTKFLTMFLPCF